jgi:hypothetical protein
MTSRDVKASYDKIIFPPGGIISAARGRTRRSRWSRLLTPPRCGSGLAARSSSASLASPYGPIYGADILAKDMRWYEANVMGTAVQVRRA